MDYEKELRIICIHVGVQVSIVLLWYSYCDVWGASKIREVNTWRLFAGGTAVRSQYGSTSSITSDNSTYIFLHIK